MSDLISREAAIKAFYIQSDDDGWWVGTAQDAETLLNGLPTINPVKWIPVSERLPIPNSVDEDVFVYYLVQNEYGDMMVATFVQFPGGARVWQQMYQYGAIMEDIVAWMPLPECYKGES